MFWSNLKFLLGFMPSIRIAECIQCQICSSPKLSQCPNCKASFPENYVIRKWTASDIPEDMVEIFITCPGCRRSLKPPAEKCSDCGAIIGREYANQSIDENVNIGQAYVNAQKIETRNPAAVIALVTSAVITAFIYFYDLPHAAWFFLIPFTMSIATLLVIRQWFRWFGSYQSEHEDFVVARRKVKDALRHWLAMFVVQISLPLLLLLLLLFQK